MKEEEGSQSEKRTWVSAVVGAEPGMVVAGGKDGAAGVEGLGKA